MKSRRIVICITGAHSGHEPDRGIEGLRAAVGLVRSTEEHEVEIVLQGAGASWLAGGNIEVSSMLAQLRSAEVPCWVSAVEGGVDGVPSLDDDALKALLEGAEVVLRY